MTVAVAFLIVCFSLVPAKTALAEGIVSFGSASYSPQGGSDFNIGVYIDKTDDLAIGDYSITFTYDPNVMTYISGAESGGNGQVVVAGRSVDGGRTQNMLTFRAANSGNSGFSAVSAVINDTTGTPMQLGALPSAPINIQEKRPDPPSYVKINGKEVPGLTEGRTEYTFSMDYVEAFEIEVPEGYTLTHNATDPVVGRNNIDVKVFQNNAEVVTYRFHVNMLENKNPEPVVTEPKSEEVKEEVKEPVSEKPSENPEDQLSEAVELPSMPLPEEKDSSLASEKKTLLVLVAFFFGIVAIIGVKFLVDLLIAQGGKRSDLRMLKEQRRMAKHEKIDEKANPFEYASIDDYKGKVVNTTPKKGKDGIVRLFDDRPGEKNGQKNSQSGKKNGKKNAQAEAVQATTEAQTTETQAPQTEANADGLKYSSIKGAKPDSILNKPLPKLDFHHRQSAGEIARNKQKSEKTLPKGADEDYIEAMDAMDAMSKRSVSDDDDFIDLENMVSDRKPNP